MAGFALMHSLQSVLPFSLGIDLVPRWVGTQVMLEGISPYSIEARQQIWQVIYGTDEPQGNVFGFYYPPAITTILIPFVITGVSIEIATVAWSALIWTIWLIAVFIIAREKNLILFTLLVISGIFFRPAFSNYILGQNALLSVLAFGYAYILVQDKEWIWAGCLLALSLLKPSFMILPVIAFLIIYRDIKLWISCILILIFLNIPSFFFIGWWIPDFLKEISSYAFENQVAWSPSIDILTPMGIIWLILAGNLMFFALRSKDWILLLSALLAFNVAFTPHTADYDLVAFLGILFWLKKYISGWQFLILIWVPWGTLFFFSEIETWYQFIWKTYPILLLAFATFITIKNFYPTFPIKNNLPLIS
jgi:hypothetical protein